jgi:hypothetical protein
MGWSLLFKLSFSMAAKSLMTTEFLDEKIKLPIFIKLFGK